MRLTILSFLTCWMWILNTPAAASVVLTGTRVIYPASSSGQTLQLSNADAHPYLVQMWVDAGDPDSTPEEALFDAPFTLSPPIFRMAPDSGQAVRLMFTGEEALPSDRESLFYLNFTQIPALTQAEREENLLLLTLKNRVKVFYRPRGLPPYHPRQIACALRVHVGADGVQIENPTAFHAVIRRAELQLDAQRVTLLKGEVLAPFSQQARALPDAFAASVVAPLHITLVNDDGADESYTCAAH